MTDDFYDLLEIPPDASQDEIKDAYRDQVRVYHPDLNDDDRAQAQFTAVQTAYDILGDPVERQAYDRLGHEEYVAKRTSGLPSPDVWKTDDGDEDDSDGTELSYSESETASASASSAAGASGAKSAAGVGGGTSSSAAAGSSASTAGTTGGTSTGTGGTGRRGSGSSSQRERRDGASANGTGQSRGTRSRSASRSDAESSIAAWWRRRNLSLPLLWLSVLVYAAGLGQFAIEHRAALDSLRAALRVTGGDPAAVWTLLSESRHGLETPVGFVRTVTVVTPPLEGWLWYGVLAGVVALAVLGLLVVRVVRRENTWGPLTIDETIVVALVLAATTTLIGGPLLAGAVLMPLLFGVIVRHTRRGAGWTPSYLYVVPVLAPLAGFGVSLAGSATLAVDLAVFAFLPVVGGLALPLRATVLKYGGR
ncbi:J domain-containing protein [Natrinema ejinorense]|uniref:Molecular chaperone DnaJ n=1 Tax=Natrinema ejinorense TaxID=373386 RepID=A0A2A5QQZ8_9EURY|nr:J domain-containing protein [Natrinema ejinorense]PCR89260.1 molecular chaperone DnaJ [Natrinema ejinorense]